MRYTERRSYTQALNKQIDDAYAAGDRETLEVLLNSKTAQFARHDDATIEYMSDRLPEKLAQYDSERVGQTGRTAAYSTFLTKVLNNLYRDWWRKSQRAKTTAQSDELENLAQVGTSDQRRNGRRVPVPATHDLFDYEDNLLDYEGDPPDEEEESDQDDDNAHYGPADEELERQPEPSGIRFVRVEGPESSDRESQHRWWRQMLRIRDTGAGDLEMAELMDVKVSAVRPTLSRWRRILREAEER